MRFKFICLLGLSLLGYIVPLWGQDSLAVRGTLGDTLQLSNATVTAKSREQRLREGAFAVGALNIRLQASTLQSLTQAIDPVGIPAENPEPKQKWDPTRIHYNKW